MGKQAHVVAKRPAAKQAGGGKIAMGKNEAQGMMNRLKSLAKAGKQEPLNTYKLSKTQAEKRKFFSTLEIDKDCSFLSVQEEHGLKEAEKAAIAVGWCYLWDVARVNGMQYIPGDETQTVFLMSLVEGCEQQNADKPSLANKGVKQYWYAKRFGNSLQETNEKNSTLKADAKV